MKTFIFVPLILMASIVLFGCRHSAAVQDHEQMEKKLTVKREQFEQKFIIRDSVNDPLPPEAKKIQTMPAQKEPQQIPNAKLNNPIVITKMPYSEKKRP
ncbi:MULTISPECIES: hypothetical protein [Parageobacillus]|jgi:hypothetical protein|uniref:Lipoprotein n=1 Tax=Parageobacillus thermoglucosidasius TaxID=1426 RepID=A0A1B7KSQ7_PARTM|nr:MULTISPECIES: hypothetical protein [Parageobacillus]OAT73107.1 hypothetical protein A7K69_18740 [Parageobacillus thermoglucosidasius]BDG46041.1 hypothetical protein PspKH34_06020 [Parageobacillus sp. KH3-4]